MCTVGIFEDEPVLQLMWEDIAETLGFKITGALDNSQSTDLATDGQMDVAILDVNLNGEVSDDILQVLESRGIPVLVCTGMQPEDLPEMFRKHDILTKPFGIYEASRRLRQACGGQECCVAEIG